jgi:hypothetical protein
VNWIGIRKKKRMPYLLSIHKSSQAPIGLSATAPLSSTFPPHPSLCFPSPSPPLRSRWQVWWQRCWQPPERADAVVRHLLLQQEVELGHEAKRPIYARSLWFGHREGCSHWHGFREMPTCHSGPQPSLPVMLLYCSKLVSEGYGMPRECAGISF